MMTVFVAAEKLLGWGEKGNIRVDVDVAAAFAGHCMNNRFVVYFAPIRFGLALETMDEVREAWGYMSEALEGAGFVPHEVMLFADDAEEARFAEAVAGLGADERAIMVSGDAQDETICDSLGIRYFNDLPSNVTGLWQRMRLERSLRTLLAAIQA